MAIRKDNIQIVLDIEAKEGVQAYQKLLDESKKVNNEMRKLKRAGKENSDEFKRLEKRAAELGREMADLGGAGANMAQLITRSRQLNRELKSLVPGTKRFIQVTEELKQVNSRLKDIRQQTKGVSNDLDEMRIAGFKVPPAMQGIANGVNKVQMAFRAFIALEVINFLVGLFRTGDEVTKQFVKLRGEIERFTGAVGEDLDEYAVKVNSIALTYNKETSEILNAANALTKQLTGDFSESLRLIEQGFLAGADQSGEFLDQVKEYPPFFREAQLSGEQMIATITQSVQEGVFSDKGVDLIKEFTLRVRELTPATQAALEGIGITSTQIRDKIEEEGIGAAFIMVQEKLREIKQDSPAAGAALADVFGAPGEDAGLQFIENLQLTEGSLENLIQDSNEYVKTLQDQYNANTELSEAQNRVAKQFGETSNSLSVYITRIKAFLFNVAADTLQFFEQLPATAQGVQSAFFAILDNIKNFFERTRLNLTVTLKQIEKLNPFGKTSEQLDREIANLRNRRDDLKKETVNVLEAYNEAFLEGLEDVDRRKAISKALAPPPADPAAIKESARRNARAYVQAEKEETEKAREEIKAIEIEDEDVDVIDEQVAERASQEDLLKNRFLKQLETERAYEDQRYQLQQESYERRLQFLRQKHGEESAAFVQLENEKLEKQRTYEQQRAELTKRTEEARQQAMGAGFNAFSGFVDATIDLLGKEESERKKNSIALKAFEAGKVVVAGISEIQQIWKNAAALGPFGQVVAAIQTAAAAARTSSALSEINSTSFYAGGHTGDKVILPDAHGGIVGAVHKNEWVAPDWMTGHPVYGQTIGWLEAMRKRGFKDGGFTTVNTTPTVPVSNTLGTAPDESRELMMMFLKSNDQLIKTIERKRFEVTTGQIRDGLQEEEELDRNSGF